MIVLQWCKLVLFVYLLVSAVAVIGAGFKSATGDQAEKLFELVDNPIMGLMVGLLATALVQSSSTVTSIIVGLVAGGLPVTLAIPLVMGANIGTSITNTLVSIGHIRNSDEFRNAFAAATILDIFNLIAATAITGQAAVAALEIALVHFMFNVLGVLVIYGIPPLRNLPVFAAEQLAEAATRRRWVALAYIVGVFFAVPAGLLVLSIIY